MNEKIKYLLVSMLVVFIMACNNQQPVQEKNVVTKENVLTDKESEAIIDQIYDETLDPPKEPTAKLGEVVFGADTFMVVEEETDQFAVISQFNYGDNGREMTTYKQREKVFHLINKKTLDTITVEKQMFKDYSKSGDFPQLLLQSVAFEIQTKSGNVPLSVSLCKPDTDICDEYSITVKNGKIQIKEVDLGEIGD